MPELLAKSDGQFQPWCWFVGDGAERQGWEQFPEIPGRRFLTI